MKVFAVEYPVDILLDCTSGAVYAWLLGDEELYNRRFANEKFVIAFVGTYKQGKIKKICQRISKI